MKHIQTITVGAGGAATIDFQNIPGSYTDLVIFTSLRQSNGNTNALPFITLNGTSSSNQSYRGLFGDGSGVFSTSYSIIYWPVSRDNYDTASTFANTMIYIPNYTQSTNKSISIESVFENNGTAARQFLGAGLWSNTAAITRVVLQSGDNTAAPAYVFNQHSSASLYGITKA